MADDTAGGGTRVDLIGRALRLMKRLHRENEERKRTIAGMGLPGQGQQDNVSFIYSLLLKVRSAQEPSTTYFFGGFMSCPYI